MEVSVSYGGGTQHGPQAILVASQQLEAESYGLCAGQKGIHTQKPLRFHSKNPSIWLNAIEAHVATALTSQAIPVLLGGEHTVTLGAARAFHALGRNIGFIHIDAHADLRDTYEGSAYSHACVMRRVHELDFPLLQIDTRAVSREEYDYRAAHPKTIHVFEAPFGHSLQGTRGRERGMKNKQDFKALFPKDFPKEVYLSFDVDGFDPSIMPATGTPVPGGLTWQDALNLLLHIAKTRRIVGIDVVEFAPIKGLHHADFTVAQLTYLLMGLAHTP